MAVRSEYKVMSEKPLLRTTCLQSMHCEFPSDLLDNNRSDSIKHILCGWLAEVVTIAAVGR